MELTIELTIKLTFELGGVASYASYASLEKT